MFLEHRKDIQILENNYYVFVCGFFFINSATEYTSWHYHENQKIFLREYRRKHE